MSIDPAHIRFEPLRPDTVLAPEAHRPSQREAGLQFESRRSPHRLVILRTRMASADTDPSGAGPDAPQLSIRRLLDELEARLADSPRDDIHSLQWALWWRQRLVELLLTDDSTDRSGRALLRERWRLLRELRHRIRQRSGSRRPPMR